MGITVSWCLPKQIGAASAALAGTGRSRQRPNPRPSKCVFFFDGLNLRRSVGGAAAETPKKQSKKQRKAAVGQKEMLMPIAGKKPAKDTT